MNPAFFIITGTFALSGVILTAAWAIYGLPGLFSITAGLTELCQSLFVRCIEYSKLIVIVTAWAGGLLAASGIAYALISGVLNLYRIRRAAGILKDIPKIGDASSAIVAIKDKNPAAFTFGLLNPRIYISSGLIRKLGRKELLGVIYHELHHKRNLDPLRLFIIRFIRDAFYYIPAVSVYARAIATKSELVADAKAAGKINDPLTLASAIIKVGRSSAVNLAASSISGDPIGLRIKRLIDSSERESSGHGPRYSLKTILASILAITFIAASLILPVTSSSYAKEVCTTEHCSVHRDRIGESCRTHCKTHKNALHSGHIHIH